MKILFSFEPAFFLWIQPVFFLTNTFTLYCLSFQERNFIFLAIEFGEFFYEKTFSFMNKFFKLWYSFSCSAGIFCFCFCFKICCEFQGFSRIIKFFIPTVAAFPVALLMYSKEFRKPSDFIVLSETMQEFFLLHFKQFHLQ